jgi:hypothetical protein
MLLLESRSPYVEDQAVLAGNLRILPEFVQMHVELRTGAPEGQGIPDPLPWRKRLRGQKTIGSARLRAIMYAFEDSDAVFRNSSPYLATGGSDDRKLIVTRGGQPSRMKSCEGSKSSAQAV